MYSIFAQRSNAVKNPIVWCILHANVLLPTVVQVHIL